MTLEELSELDDAELNRLAAERVMGWTDCGMLDVPCYHDANSVTMSTNFTPTTDRNQSGKLLAKMVERGAQIGVRFGKSGNNVDVWSADKKEPLVVPGNSARSETIAALLAALLAAFAMEGKNNA